MLLTDLLHGNTQQGLNHGYPVMLRMDNRSEFNTLALTLAEWA
ncbi:hypothetical protein ABOB21_25850 [Escherichia coli]